MTTVAWCSAIDHSTLVCKDSFTHGMHRSGESRVSILELVQSLNHMLMSIITGNIGCVCTSSSKAIHKRCLDVTTTSYHYRLDNLGVEQWAPHWIANNGKSNRIHIVIDTVGSPTLWEWIESRLAFGIKRTPRPKITRIPLSQDRYQHQLWRKL